MPYYFIYIIYIYFIYNIFAYLTEHLKKCSVKYEIDTIMYLACLCAVSP